ncbi:putative P-loop containing nucleoside triphosphate hydrolase, leucine-rich repeat domain, L [Rosa chinensis]|uniref:Putative P-loop containing nucleoside triphosphate hydrolase, leucine-rich repeat domain, L n=1 Tax=Rosa chinensis TaxID=74649 RepID=A0A2P6SMH5_ROSCH|nr:disease resistance protein RPM1 [Rosa chinensis]PRQ59898.1 putative P-loop containing nucleoside triphosphate hydrolase, leucine-rich repeat domain, L [Rosa chinensis]
MAESVVCFVIDKLISFLVTTEAKISRDVHKEISCIRDELESIRSFLRDADAKAAREGEVININESSATWVKQVREAAYHIEDVIDEYLLRITKKHQERGFLGLLRKVTWFVQKMKPEEEMALKIEGMKTLVCDVKARSERYGFNSTEQGGERTINSRRWHDPRMASLFIEEAQVVGIESARDELITWFVQGGGAASSLSSSTRAVISVVGMGGLGKTTLAKKVYDNQVVIEHFDCYAWITVSQLYRIEDVLRMMIMQFYKARQEYIPHGVDAMDEESLIRKSREYLQQKRYVVVFDDVWNVDFWGAIEHALPDNDKGGRIMITTRIKDVADFCKRSSFVHVHYLQPLSPDKAWELFCRKAFQFDQLEGKCPPELEGLSLRMVKKCEGLPLAIVSLGGLLSTKAKVLSEWKKLYDSLSSELENNPHLSSLTRILSLSYHHLPYYLKSCVLYFGIFPEDYSISCIRLVRLWIAEGFVKVTKGKTLEEVAEGYLTELIHRSLVQVSKVYIDGKARSCRVHDLLREVFLRKALDSSFCHMLSEDDSTFTPTTRRLSIDSSLSDALGSKSIEQSHIRSVFTFNQDEWPNYSFLNTISANFKLLKVLDFADAPIQHLPKYVGSLYYLRYLSLRNTKVKLLPKSIAKLQNLETLDLKQSLVCEIPAKLNKLLKLRHILACYCDYKKNFSMSYERGVMIDDGVGCLLALQKLYHVDANHGGIRLIQELRKLRQLRKLGLKNLRCEDGQALCASIENMNHLESLEVCAMGEDEVLDVQSISTPPESIRFLYLKGRLEKLPSWISKLEHLVKLRIFWSRLRDDPLKALQNLPNLLELGLSYKAYDGVQLHFEEGGFQKLKLLKLKHLEGLNSLIIDNGVMPLLQELQLGPSPQLKEVPSGIHHLRDLRTLRFVDMPEAFRRGMDGQHYWVVEHVTDVLFSYKLGPRCDIYETHTLLHSNSSAPVPTTERIYLEL